MNGKRLTVAGENFVCDVRRRLDQIDVRFPFQSLLHNLHMQQAQESAAKAEAQRVTAFRLEFETWIVDRELVERVAQFSEILAVGWIESAINHPFRLFVARQ